MNRLLGALAFSMAVPAAAVAQDFGSDWIDQVTHELQTERGPLKTRAANWNATGGVAYQFDDNVFLTEDDEESSSVVIPFVAGRIDYATQRFEVQAQLLANYKWYNNNDIDADDDEERLYVRARQTDARYTLEFAEILQKVSDPIGAVFVDRVDRLVSNTVLHGAFDVTKQWAVELGANLQLVRFDKDVFSDPTDNDNVRADLSVVYRTFWSFDALAQVGYQDIAYNGSQSEGAPPDAFGYYARLGYRGELIQSLSVEAFAGYAHIETDFFQGTELDDEGNTMDVAFALRYDATEKVKFTADYTRQFAFAFGDPFQIVNRFMLIENWEVTPKVGLKARLQYDHVDTSSGTERDYLSAAISSSWKAMEKLLVDGGFTWRMGDTDFSTGADSEFDNVIVHFGVAYTW
jgi:hypothetical protein